MELGILPALTKDYVLSKISQEQIFEFYLGIPVEPDVLIKVPRILRIDNNPTASFYYNEYGKLRFRDFAGFWGDCFDLVAHLSQISPHDRKGFMVVLERIARDFKIHKYAGKDTIITGSTFDERDTTYKTKTKRRIEVKTRNFNKRDADFWLQGYVRKKQMDKFYIRPCQFIWLDGELTYTYNPFDPAYAYYFGDGNFRIYFPFRKEYRFLSNCSPLQGEKQLGIDYIGLITKSYKDVASLDAFDIPAVAPSSEGIMMTKEEWGRIRYNCTHWFSLMDYDTPGIKMAKKLRDAYNIRPLFFAGVFKDQNKHKVQDMRKFPKLYNNYVDYGVKDFFEFATKINNTEKIKEIIAETKEKFSDELDRLDNHLTQNLKFLKAYAR